MYSLTFRVRVMLPQQRNPCIDCKFAKQCTTRGHPLPLPQITSGSVQQCRHATADRQTQTHTQTRVTTIHFASSTTHAKCNHFNYAWQRNRWGHSKFSTSDMELAGSTVGLSSVTQRPQASCLHTHTCPCSPCSRICTDQRRRRSEAGKVTAGVAKSNVSLDL